MNKKTKAVLDQKTIDGLTGLFLLGNVSVEFVAEYDAISETIHGSYPEFDRLFKLWVAGDHSPGLRKRIYFDGWRRSRIDWLNSRYTPIYIFSWGVDQHGAKPECLRYAEKRRFYLPPATKKSSQRDNERRLLEAVQECGFDPQCFPRRQKKVVREYAIKRKRFVSEWQFNSTWHCLQLRGDVISYDEADYVRYRTQD